MTMKTNLTSIHYKIKLIGVNMSYKGLDPCFRMKNRKIFVYTLRIEDILILQIIEINNTVIIIIIIYY